MNDFQHNVYTKHNLLNQKNVILQGHIKGKVKKDSQQNEVVL